MGINKAPGTSHQASVPIHRSRAAKGARLHAKRDDSSTFIICNDDTGSNLMPGA